MTTELPSWFAQGGIVLIGISAALAVLAAVHYRAERRNLRAFLEGEDMSERTTATSRVAPVVTSERALTVVAAAALALVTQVLVGQMIVTLCVGAVAIVVLEGLRSKRRQRQQTLIATQFADSLSGFASTMTAGNSFARGLQQVVQGAPEPIRHEWEQVLAEVELGSQVSTAVQGMADRTQLAEVEWLAHVLRLHERTGTPAAALLKQIAAIVRQNEGLELEITGLTAEGRLAAYVVAALPVGLVIFIQFAQPGYLDPLSTGKGLYVSIAMVASIVTGLFWIKRMVRQVEV